MIHTNDVIIIDTREQKPYEFAHDVQRKKLDTGDYSVLSYEDDITVERKSLTDFLGCLFPHKNNKNGGWIRFEKELIRLKGIEYRCIVIEATWKQIVNGTYGKSKAHPNSVIGKMMKIMIEYGTPIFMAGNHKLGSSFVEKFLIRSVKQVDRDVGIPER